MIRSAFLAISVCLVLQPAPAAARPAASVASAATRSLPRLAGTTWHTRNLDGPLFFVVRGIGVSFGADGTFTAKVAFIDDQTTLREGTYAIDGRGHLTLTIAGLPPQQVRYWRDGKDIMLRDEAHDVTGRLVPGPMTEDGWF